MRHRNWASGIGFRLPNRPAVRTAWLRNPDDEPGVSATMHISRRLPLIVVGAALVVGACTAAAQPLPSGSPPGGQTRDAGSPTSSAGNPVGPTDVVLRYEEGGGFMPVEWSLGSTPIFTLYGDGTVILRDIDEQPASDENGRMVFPALTTARLSPDQTAALLDFALGEGGLAAAREQYDNPTIADAGNAIFTVNAGGGSKTVTVSALMESDANAPDQLARSQFSALAKRLRNFDKDVENGLSEYQPSAWRAYLLEGTLDAPEVQPWPWPDLTPADFAAPADAPAFPSRVLNAEEVAALGVAEPNGGIMGHYLEGPDKRVYGLVVRPLLPGEEA
jgi:hypothetical protein